MDNNVLNSIKLSHRIDFCTAAFMLFSVTFSAQSPGGIRTTSLAVWYKANVGATNTTWSDQSGNAHNLSGTATLNSGATANAINYNPVETFNGTSNVMSTLAGNLLESQMGACCLQLSYYLLFSL